MVEDAGFSGGMRRHPTLAYNTYLYAGLPPGPIAAPGLSSIRAVLTPDQHDYLYFVALPGWQRAPRLCHHLCRARGKCAALSERGVTAPLAAGRVKA